MSAGRPVTDFSIEAIIGRIGGQLKLAAGCCATVSGSTPAGEQEARASCQQISTSAQHFLQSIHASHLLQHLRLDAHLAASHRVDSQPPQPAKANPPRAIHRLVQRPEDEAEEIVDVVNVVDEHAAKASEPDDEDVSFYQYATKTQSKRCRPKRHVCPICALSLSNRGQLISHIRSHTGERPFKCEHPTCSKAFTRNEELTRHKRIHTGQKPYPCHICSKRFGRKDHLKKHVRTHTRRGVSQPLFPPPVGNQSIQFTPSLNSGAPKARLTNAPTNAGLNFKQAPHPIPFEPSLASLATPTTTSGRRMQQPFNSYLLAPKR